MTFVPPREPRGQLMLQKRMFSPKKRQVGISDLKNKEVGEPFRFAFVVPCNQRDMGGGRSSVTGSSAHGDTAEISGAVEMGGKPFLHSSRCRLHLTSELRARTVVSRTLSVPGAASVQAKISA